MKKFLIYASLPLLLLITQPAWARSDGRDKATNFWVEHARDVVASTYGDNISIEKKRKDLIKFGESESVGNAVSDGYTIMTLPGSETEETFVTTNIITHFSSGDAADTSIPVTIEGHTCSGGVPTTFIVQTATTDASDGRTKTALTTPICRVTRGKNAGSTELVDPFYVAEDVTFTAGVPQTDSAIHLLIPAGKDQSLKASTSLSSQDYWIITDFCVGVLEKTAAFSSAWIEVRQPGGVFLPITEPIQTSSTSGQSCLLIPGPYYIIPKSSDVRIQATASGANIHTTGHMGGYLAIVE